MAVGIRSAIGLMLKPLCKNITGVNRSGQPQTGFDHTLTHEMLSHKLPFDIIINTMPLTSATHSYFDHDFFTRCDRVLFINVGRGTSVVEQALIEALNASSLSVAVLDVFDIEPLPFDNPLWHHPAVVVTPHQASKTSINDMQQSFDQIVRAMKLGKQTDLMVDISRGY